MAGAGQALMRILSFMRINPNISQLSETFSNSRQNIAQFGVVLLLLLLCFQVLAPARTPR